MYLNLMEIMKLLRFLLRLNLADRKGEWSYLIDDWIIHAVCEVGNNNQSEKGDWEDSEIRREE